MCFLGLSTYSSAEKQGRHPSDAGGIVPAALELQGSREMGTRGAYPFGGHICTSFLDKDHLEFKLTLIKL